MNFIISNNFIIIIYQELDVYAIFLITSGKQTSNNCAPCLIKINFVVIPSYIECPW